MSFQRSRTTDETPTDASPPLYPVAATDVATVERAAVTWKESQPAWKALSRLPAE